MSSSSPPPFTPPLTLAFSPRRSSGASFPARRAARVSTVTTAAAKRLYFNADDGAALKKMQRGVDKLAHVVGVTLGPKGRNVVLESKYGSPKIVNDGVTVAKEVELADPVENTGARLVRQACLLYTSDAADE